MAAPAEGSLSALTPSSAEAWYGKGHTATEAECREWGAASVANGEGKTYTCEYAPHNTRPRTPWLLLLLVN